jgi:hypothetical protein
VTLIILRVADLAAASLGSLFEHPAREAYLVNREAGGKELMAYSTNKESRSVLWQLL